MPALFLSGWPVDLYFKSSNANTAAVVISWLLIGLAMVVFARMVRQGLWRGIAMTFAVLGVLVSLLMAFLGSAFSNAVGRDVVASVNQGGSHFQLVRTNAGATTDFGLVLEKTQTFFGVLETRKRLWSRYHVYQGSLSFSGKDTLVVTVDPYGQEYPADTVKIELR
ncbi:hypothetical protein [Kordiimonas marina]|uniref:hypothetical protein n=1 Tax=Kordiimonas marina TaxID=2872312 RepID=UPI001FF6EF88|nr:hypothetical protein [Kordiimonas marina]MCJ9427932.1 hypothetical protein [Kordiimonas marina]